MQNLKVAIGTVTMLAAPLMMPLHPAMAQACTCAGPGIRSEEAPPPLPDYDQPPVPGPGYIWTPGYWAWNNMDYYWVPGTWVAPPRPGLLWTPGYWGFVGGIYVFNPGYWGPHVGFYGGIPYGFGYSGSGYQGGRWTNGTFFYNRTVNNFGNASITNVYNETVVSNNGAAGRASFNGGPGGTAARPTAEEEAASREPHERSTNQQLANMRAASLNERSFASANHGIPTVAATRQPGNLNGPGAVKAREVAPPKLEPAAEDKHPKEQSLPSVPHQPAPHGPEAESKPPQKPATEQTRTEAPQEQKKPETDSNKPEHRPGPPASVPHDSQPEAPHAAQAHPKEPIPKAEPPQHAASPKPAVQKPKPAPEHQDRKCEHPGEPGCR